MCFRIQSEVTLIRRGGVGGREANEETEREGKKLKEIRLNKESERRKEAWKNKRIIGYKDGSKWKGRDESGRLWRRNWGVFLEPRGRIESWRECSRPSPRAVIRASWLRRTRSACVLGDPLGCLWNARCNKEFIVPIRVNSSEGRPFWCARDVSGASAFQKKSTSEKRLSTFFLSRDVFSWLSFVS